MPPLPGGIWRLIGILHFGNQKFQTNQTSNVTLVEKRFDV